MMELENKTELFHYLKNCALFISLTKNEFDPRDATDRVLHKKKIYHHPKKIRTSFQNKL